MSERELLRRRKKTANEKTLKRVRLVLHLFDLPLSFQTLFHLYYYMFFLLKSSGRRFSLFTVIYNRNSMRCRQCRNRNIAATSRYTIQNIVVLGFKGLLSRLFITWYSVHHGSTLEVFCSYKPSPKKKL